MPDVEIRLFRELRNIPKNIAVVYVCERQNETVKCGFSSCLKHRISGLRCKGYTELYNPHIAFVTVDMRHKWGSYGSTSYLEWLERMFFRYLPTPCIKREVFPLPFEEAIEQLKNFARDYCENIKPNTQWVKYKQGEKSHD
jgi:hypothetical protein